jgi:hypothetical protein
MKLENVSSGARSYATANLPNSSRDVDQRIALVQHRKRILMSMHEPLLYVPLSHPALSLTTLPPTPPSQASTHSTREMHATSKQESLHLQTLTGAATTLFRHNDQRQHPRDHEACTIFPSCSSSAAFNRINNFHLLYNQINQTGAAHNSTRDATPSEGTNTSVLICWPSPAYLHLEM